MGPSLGEPLAQIGPSEMANSLAVLRLAGKHFHVAALEGSGWIQRKWDHKLESTGVGVEKLSTSQPILMSSVWQYELFSSIV
jgi:hypothetical protein